MATTATVYPFLSMDDLTAELVIELMLQDSEEVISSSKGKSREGQLSDAEVALSFMKEDLELHASIIADRRMTRSIARAVQSDGDVLTEALCQEQVAAGDREEACRLGGHQTPGHVEPWTISAAEMDEEVLAKLNALYVSCPANDDEKAGPAGADSPYTSGVPPTMASSSKGTYRKSIQCIACLQDFQYFYDVARAPCGHEYCRDCLQDLFRSSMTDESLFPPKCCKQPITTGVVRVFLTSDLVHEYEQKKIEYETPNRTYCCLPRCSTFIREENITGDQGVCPDCGMVTCTICKGAIHEGDCPADISLQLVLKTATEEGWQRCCGCRRLIELDTGCNHMTCPCGSQFCYICGERWKSCPCPQFTEERLLQRAEQVVARQRPEPGPARQAQVAAAIENLRTRHDCDHERWRYVRGAHRCEECFHNLPSYIFECTQCQILACNRCRRNRL